MLLDESGHIPAKANTFDIVYCSSMIEHVTVDKSEMWEVRDGAEFRSRTRERQKRLAGEIRRVGRGYFVQTPHRHFPIESHTWLPGVAWLPRPRQLWLIERTNRWGPKETIPDWHLLTTAELAGLFPEAEIVRERSLGMVKSIMAVRAPR
jgi:hypothetical protein